MGGRRDGSVVVFFFFLSVLCCCGWNSGFGGEKEGVGVRIGGDWNCILAGLTRSSSW